MTLTTTARSTLAWAFGVCLSILFISLWGRAVVADTDTLGEALAPLMATDAVGDVVAGWMAEELTESGADPALAESTAEVVFRSATVESAFADLVGEVVIAAASTDPAGARIDIRPTIAPAIPEVASTMADRGYRVTEGEVRDVIEGLDPLVIRQAGETALVGPGSPAASRLGTASLLAAIGLLCLGALYTYLADDRLLALRSLVNRVAVGGLSFAVLLRLGSWVADPRGGRAPVQETIANLAASKWLVPLQVEGGAGVVASTIYLVRRYVTPGGGFRSADESPTPEREPAHSR